MSSLSFICDIELALCHLMKTILLPVSLFIAKKCQSKTTTIPASRRIRKENALHEYQTNLLNSTYSVNQSLVKNISCCISLDTKRWIFYHFCPTQCMTLVHFFSRMFTGSKIHQTKEDKKKYHLTKEVFLFVKKNRYSIERDSIKLSSLAAVLWGWGWFSNNDAIMKKTIKQVANHLNWAN